MGPESSPDSDFELERIVARASARYRHVVFPFELREFSACLIELGYMLPGPLPPEPPSGTPVVGLSAKGPVAAKDNFLVDINMERQFFGVAGGDPVSVFERLSEILDILSARNLASLEKVHFYELQARYRLAAENVVKSMFNSGRKSEMVKKATEAIGTKMGLFSARLMARDTEIDSPDYLEFYVQPTISRPDSEIGVAVVYRNPDPETFGGFVSGCEDAVSAFLSSLLE